MTGPAVTEALLTSTPDAPWLPPGSTAEVWAGTDCTQFEPAVIVRLAVWDTSGTEPSFFCVRTAKGLDLPTRFLGSGADRESVQDGLTRLSSQLLGRPSRSPRCIGYVRNVVPRPNAEYPHPTPTRTSRFSAHPAPRSSRGNR